MVILAPNIKLNNGYEIPAIGFGTYSENKEEAAILTAIDAGYRHFDTAYMYGNEKEVGNAIRAKIEDGVIKREDVFITSKIWSIFHHPEKVEHACRLSLKRLNLDYIDLYLIHSPIGLVYHDDETIWPKNPDSNLEVDDIDYLDTWREMEKLVHLGLVRSIGVSNFNSEQVDRILHIAVIKPVTNQIECNLSIAQKKLTKFCMDRDIIITAYTPLGLANLKERTPKFLFNSDIEAIGKKYNKTAAQIALRYLYELRVIPIPKSFNSERIKENIDIFDFQLSDDDKKLLDKFDIGFRILDLKFIEHAKHYPFHLEF